MKKTARKTTKRRTGSTNRATLTEVHRAELRDFVISSGMKALEMLLEEERTEI